MKAILFNIQKFSIHDGPGIRTVIFFKGCHLKCRWCCNPESQSEDIQLSFDKDKCTGCLECIKICHPKALKFQDGRIQYDKQKCTRCNRCVSCCLKRAITFYGKEYSLDEVIKEVLKDKAFYDKSGGGVTLSGGEVFLQADFARELCRKLASENIKVALETSLAVSSAAFNKLNDHVHTWLVDLKHYNEKQFALGTGAKYADFFNNIKQLISRNSNVIIRIPVIPDYNNSTEDAEQFSLLLRKIGIVKVELLPFHQFGEKKYELINRLYSLKGIPGLNKNDLTEFSQVFENHNIQIQIGG